MWLAPTCTGGKVHSHSRQKRQFLTKRGNFWIISLQKRQMAVPFARRDVGSCQTSDSDLSVICPKGCGVRSVRAPPPRVSSA